MSRKDVYSKISNAVGYTFHIGEIQTVEELIRVDKIIRHLFF